MNKDHKHLLVEFDTPAKCLSAADALHTAGYRSFDSHTPFPIHGMDKAMGLKDTPLGWIVLCGGLTGCTLGFTMIWWMNAVDYPLIIGGKPPLAFASMIPVMFELTILLSALSTVFGLFHLMKLPQHHHPLFESDRFRGFSDDKFFISVSSEDPKFDESKTRDLLASLHPTHVEVLGG